MNIELISGFERPDDVRALFAEYIAMLVENDPAFQAYLDIQRYDDELKDLGMKYAPPGGRLYLALADGEPVGCGAIRRLDGARCELKRLYVRPAFRGHGIARRLMQTLVADARAAGYARMLLDTLPFLTTAIDMYRRMGFRDIPSYNDSPLAETIYMGMDL